MAYAEQLKPMMARRHRRAARPASRRQGHHVRRCSGFAAGHRPRYLPVRHQLQHHGWRYRHRFRFRPLYLDYILGITKAYTTRVGSGPFPTELFDDAGAFLAKRGHEFGSTTGRARRCGWFDAVILRRAIEINSISGLCLTKLDVLDGLETIRICTGYKDANGQVLVDAPTDADSYIGLQPVYEEMPGWSESTLGAKTLEDLPASCSRLHQACGRAGRCADRHHLHRPGSQRDRSCCVIRSPDRVLLTRHESRLRAAFSCALRGGCQYSGHVL